MQLLKKNKELFLILSILITLNVSIYPLPYELRTSLSLIKQKLKNSIGIIGDGMEINYE